MVIEFEMLIMFKKWKVTHREMDNDNDARHSFWNEYDSDWELVLLWHIYHKNSRNN